MTSFHSHAQANQDTLVYLLLIKTGIVPVGRFLDVGANHPTVNSNTFALEQRGWTGFLFDNDDTVERLCREQRKAQFVRGDVTTLDFGKALGENRHFDYISLDVDENTPKALENLLNHGVTFKVATVEHDKYRFGLQPQYRIEELLKERYVTIARNVCSEGCPFENWYMDLGCFPDGLPVYEVLYHDDFADLDHAEVIRLLEAAL